MLWGQTSPWTKVTYLAYYDMNRSSDASRAKFLARATKIMSGF